MTDVLHRHFNAPRLVAALAVFLASCGVAPPSRAPAMPQRIVSLAPNLTDIIVELGAADRLVGVSTFCKSPRDDIARVGGYLDPDVESIIALKPDLVLTPPNPRLEQAMASFDVPVRVFQSQWSTLRDIRASILAVAAALGHSEAGVKLVTAIDAQLDAVRREAAGRPVRGVLFVVERQPGSIIAAGAGTHLTELLAVAGGSNVVTEGTPYPALDIENTVKLAPEVIIDVSPQARAGDVQAVWRDYQTIPAARSGSILASEPDLLVQPGPGIGRSARLLFEMIHRGETP